jgi:hypothetical protein
MNLKNSFERLHFGDIKRLPNGIFEDVTETELASVIIFVIENLNEYRTIQDICKISRNELFTFGFGNLLRGRVFEDKEPYNTYTLLKLAYPEIKPWMVECKPPGFYSSKDNVFELIRYNFGDVTNISRRELTKKMSSRTIVDYWHSTEDLVDEYNLWLSNKKEKQKIMMEKLTIYKNVISGKLSRCPANYWLTMTEDEIVLIMRYVIEVLLTDPHSIWDGDFVKLDFAKYHLPTFTKPLEFSSGLVITTKRQFIEYILSKSV